MHSTEDRRHVGLQLGRSFSQDERLPHWFQDVVRHQDQEDVQRQQQRCRSLPGVHVGEESEKAFEARTFRCFCGHSHFPSGGRVTRIRPSRAARTPPRKTDRKSAFCTGFQLDATAGCDPGSRNIVGGSGLKGAVDGKASPVDVLDQDDLVAALVVDDLVGNLPRDQHAEPARPQPPLHPLCCGGHHGLRTD